MNQTTGPTLIPWCPARQYITNWSGSLSSRVKSMPSTERHDVVTTSTPLKQKSIPTPKSVEKERVSANAANVQSSLSTPVKVSNVT